MPTAESIVVETPAPRGLRVDWRVDVGHVITFIVLAVGFAVQYGALSTRVSAIEIQSARQAAATEQLAAAVHSLEGTIIRVETQLDERQRRADSATVRR